MTNELTLARVLSDFAYRLANDYETTDALHDLVDGVTEVMSITGAAISLASGDAVSFATASDESTGHLERIQQEKQSGPGIEAFRSGIAALVGDLTGAPERWPAFCQAALKVGVVAVAGIPMRLDGTSLGVLTLYDSGRREWVDDDVAVAKLLADLATGWVVNADRLAKVRQTSEQLQTALNSRVVIEQAKGVLAGERGVSVEDAFEVLRSHARSHNASLRSVADAVVNLGLRP